MVTVIQCDTFNPDVKFRHRHLAQMYFPLYVIYFPFQNNARCRLCGVDSSPEICNVDQSVIYQLGLPFLNAFAERFQLTVFLRAINRRLGRIERRWPGDSRVSVAELRAKLHGFDSNSV